MLVTVQGAFLYVFLQTERFVCRNGTESQIHRTHLLAFHKLIKIMKLAHQRFPRQLIYSGIRVCLLVTICAILSWPIGQVGILFMQLNLHPAQEPTCTINSENVLEHWAVAFVTRYWHFHRLDLDKHGHIIYIHIHNCTHIYLRMLCLYYYWFYLHQTYSLANLTIE